MSEKQRQDERRKQLLQQNAQILTDSELVALLLRSGTQGKTSVDLAEELLIQMGGLPGLLEIQRKQFCQIKGLGEAKYVSLKAGMEIAWRLHNYFEQMNVLPTTDKSYRFLLSTLRKLGYHVFVGLFLDKHHNPLSLVDIIVGDMDDLVVDNSELLLEEIFTQASEYQTTNFMLAHNYPMGNGCPMPIDISLAQIIFRELSSTQLQMLDYVVVGKYLHTSLADRGFLVP